MDTYQRAIMEATHCTPEEAREVEEVMREDIFHSTLDWQPRALLDKAARLGLAYLRGEPIPAKHARAIKQGTGVRLA